MIEKSSVYKQAIVGDSRRTHLQITISLVSPDIQFTGSEYSSILFPELFDNSKMHDAKQAQPAGRVATLELNRWLLDRSTTTDKRYAGNFTSSVMADGAPQWFELQFSNCSVLQAFTINFSRDVADGVPKDFSVSVKSGVTEVFSQTVTDNEETSASFDGFLVYDPTSIRITVSAMSIPGRRLRLHSFILGIYEEWTEDNVGTLSIKHQADFSCATLPYGTCVMGIDNEDRRFEPRNKEGIFQSIQERQAVPVSIGVEVEGGEVDYTPAGVFYQHSTGWKTSDNGLILEWSLVDILGLLADRDYTPTVVYTTLQEWATDILAQLGTSFASKLTIDPNYADKQITVNSIDDISGKTCGNMVLYICQASGTFPRADAETGNLCLEPLWNQGNYVSLDNIERYPTMSANDDVSIITFTLSDDTEVVVTGNNQASDKSINIRNPFLHTRAQALECAKNILTMYGGNAVEIIGRGDPSSEVGDVDTIQLDESTATSARRIQQEFEFKNGVMTGLQSSFVQPDGGMLYRDSELITESGQWTAPAGVTSIRLVIGGGGSGGFKGSRGSYTSSGKAGADGKGGKIFSQTIAINAGQTFSISIGAGGAEGQDGTATTFGAYSSENGVVYDPSFTDVMSGNTYGRTGVQVPLAGTSDGGKGGLGGEKGNRHTARYVVSNPDGTVTVKTKTVTDNRPGAGGAGTAGASGFVLIYYDKPAEGGA